MHLLSLPAGSAKHELEKEMASHVLAFGELVGTYHKKQQSIMFTPKERALAAAQSHAQ